MLRRSLQLWMQGQLIPFLGLLVLLASGFKQLTLCEKGLLGEMGLVLLVDPVSVLMESHCELHDHDFEYLLGLDMEEFTLGDEVTDAHGQYIYTLIWELPNIREQFFPEGPKVLLRLSGCPSSI